MSTEIAKSFTSKDLAETFPRQVASLDYLHESSFSQSEEVMGVQTADLGTFITDDHKADVLTVGSQESLDSSPDEATSPSVGHEVNAITQFFSVLPVYISSSDYRISASEMIPPTGLVFGDPLPWNLPSDTVVGTKDIIEYTDSQIPQYQLQFNADSGLLLNIQDLELQFPTEDIFPAAEPFYG